MSDTSQTERVFARAAAIANEHREWTFEQALAEAAREQSVVIHAHDLEDFGASGPGEFMPAPINTEAAMPEPEAMTFFIAPGTRDQSRRYLHMLADMWDLHIRKAAGYSGHSPDVWANFRTMEALGVPDELGVYIRMNDKFNRLKSLVQDPRRDLVNEPIEDLLEDIAAYAIIARCLRAEARDGSS